MDGISVLVTVVSATVTATATAEGEGECTATGPDDIFAEFGQLSTVKTRKRSAYSGSSALQGSASMYHTYQCVSNYLIYANIQVVK